MDTQEEAELTALQTKKAAGTAALRASLAGLGSAASALGRSCASETQLLRERRLERQRLRLSAASAASEADQLEAAAAALGEELVELEQRTAEEEATSATLKELRGAQAAQAVASEGIGAELLSRLTFPERLLGMRITNIGTQALTVEVDGAGGPGVFLIRRSAADGRFVAEEKATGDETRGDSALACLLWAHRRSDV